MSYDEPSEWRGRGAAGREGWPTSGSGRPGGPRRHRADRWDEPTTDTGIDPSRFRHNQPPYEPPPIVVPPPVVHVFERDPEGLARIATWVTIFRDVLVVIALLAMLWLLGTTISHGGIPLWLPGR